MEKQRVVLLVSSDPSDIYFANHISRAVNAIGIIVEHQTSGVSLKKKIAKALRFIWHPVDFLTALQSHRLQKKMQQKASEVTEQGFGDAAFELMPPLNCKVVHVYGKSSINNEASINAIRDFRPDLMAVCGTSILKEGILSLAPRGVLNLHGGLAQRYRGVWTTHWAVFNNEPECVGATVHFVSPGIDDGDIVFQGRPVLDGTENTEMLYVKVVKLGIEMMIAAINAVASGTAQRFPLEVKGQLYLSKMVTPEMLQKCWEITEAGGIRDYLAEKETRDAEILPLMRGIFTGTKGENAKT